MADRRHGRVSVLGSYTAPDCGRLLGGLGMPAPEITIDVAPKEEFVGAVDLVSVLHNFLEIIGNIERAISPNHKAVADWRISSASLHSPLHLTLLENTRPADEIREALSACLGGFRLMESDELLSEAPPHFDPSTLGAAKRLARSLNRDLSSLTLSSPGIDSVTCTRRTFANIEDLLAAKFKAKGALEGFWINRAFYEETSSVFMIELESTESPVTSKTTYKKR